MVISAEVIEDSIANDIRITTLELNYPRFIHSEYMTHRMFSRNASSSRAIPIDKMIEQVRRNPATPIHWGKNQAGMQAKEELDSSCGKMLWGIASRNASDVCSDMNKAGYHKQIVNRLLEPFQLIKVVVTATEWDNFFAVRLHEDAQPEMYELASCMKEAMDSSTPKELEPGVWHLPYVAEDERTTLNRDNTSIKCSVARCARVSYNNHDDSSPNISKDIALADRLLRDWHMSPFEHQGSPMTDEDYNYQKGVTHIDRNGNLWSSNFRGWIMYRNLINV